ncbi:hypothetical protein NQ317_014729, partial [Molorchus minor]
PSNVNGQNVLISQEQQRKMYDTLNTSIMGMQNNPWANDQQHGNFIQAQKQFIPGGVMFTFNSQPPPSESRIYDATATPSRIYAATNPRCCCTSPIQNLNTFIPSTLEQQIAISGIQKHGLESLQYQQQLANNPFQLKFHHNKMTSCSDLLNGITQMPGSRE